MKTILTPIVTTKLTLKNRLVYPPMASSKATEDGLVSEETLKFYDDITKSKNIGLVIVEHSYISIEGKASSKQTSIATNETIEPMKKLVEIIHKNEAKVILQINHAGSATTKEITGEEPVGPSATPNPRKGNFHPLTSAIKEVVDIPVILTGGITDIIDGNRLIEENKSDLIGVGRAIFKDYTWSEREMKKIEA